MTAVLPDYSIKQDLTPREEKLSSSVSGVLGGGVTLIVALLAGAVLKRRGAKGGSRGNH
jgi:hypothetical protein